MRGVSTAFWSIVLLGSTVSIAAGLAGGRATGVAGSLPPPPAVDASVLPAPVRQRLFTRQLTGPHSLDEAVAADPYGDPSLAVAGDGTPQRGFDPRRDRAKIAVLVIDAGRAGGALTPFVTSQLPLGYVVDASDEDALASCTTIRDAGEPLLIDATAAAPSTVSGLLRGGAAAVIGSLDTARARALMGAVNRRTLVVDTALTEDDDLAAVARATRHRTLVRDVIADARDDAPYVDFMLRDALALAQRNGSVIVAIHARTESFNALERFADRAERDGAELVPLADIDR